MNIASVRIDPPTVFAPLAGISNLPLRLLAKQAGCGLVCSEMISANGLTHGAAKTWQLLASAPEEKPLAVQIFGADPDIMARAGRLVQEAGADIVDLNFGCSVKKILKSGSGAALMRDPRAAEPLLKAVRAAVSIPLTIKIRSGWDGSGDQAALLAQIAQDCGIDAIAVHPRSARQAFSGSADWGVIARIKRLVRIPVIGNGDVTCAADALRMFRETGCDAVMVGRAAIGHPFIFEQIRELLAGRPVEDPTRARRFAVMRRYVAASVRHLGEIHACLMLRSRLGWFARGLPQAARFRMAIRHIGSEAEALALIDQFEQTAGMQIPEDPAGEPDSFLSGCAGD
jgi:nifR3 family TIM-barrel protein